MVAENLSVWGLITGVIRDEAFLASRLNFFSGLKKDGYVEQVVLSTWKGEINKFPAIANIIKNSGFILVESNEPDVICRGHFLHQMISLRNGIDVCPDGVFILRTRTDKCGPESGVIEEQLAAFLESKNHLRVCEGASPVFKYKIGTLAYHTEVSNTAPVLFFWHDRAYFGMKGDLKKFINFNVMAFGYNKMIPEQVLFSGPFIKKWPIFVSFFNGINQSEAVEKLFFNSNELLQGDVERLTAFLLGNELFRFSFICERYLLHKYFFDIPTGNDFELRSVYRGIDALEGYKLDDVISYSIDEDNEQMFSSKAAELAAYLHENFNIAPVVSRAVIVEDGMHSYVTPKANLVIKSDTN